MNDRYSDLTRIKLEEYETIANYAMDFFNPLQSVKYRKELGLPIDQTAIRPLSGFDFYNYLSEKVDKDYGKQLYKIHHILKSLEQAEILFNEGKHKDVFLGDYYYVLKELTTVQQRNNLWLGEAFGISYIRCKLEPNVIHITGLTDDGRIGNGTGFLINSTSILTCKHVVSDMRLHDKVSVLNGEYYFHVICHPVLDIALILLEESVENENLQFPAFNNSDILDEVLVMGYPPIPCSDDAYVVFAQQFLFYSKMIIELQLQSRFQRSPESEIQALQLQV